MEVSRPAIHHSTKKAASRHAIAQVIERLRRGEARRDVIVIGALLTLAIFVVDLFIPIGIAGGVLYIAPVFLAIWLPDRRLIIGVAAVCTGLILAGLWLSPLGSDLSIALPNRLLSIAAVWTVALLSVQRMAFEAALTESEATNRAILATTADGILTLDEAGYIASTNPAVEAIFGHEEHDLLGRHFSLLLDDEHANHFQRNQDVSLCPDDGKTPVTHEMVGCHESGRTFPIEADLVPVRYENGVRCTVTIRDISERRLLEQYLLRRSNDERRAIGETLHEEVGQALTGLSLISRQLAKRLEAMNLDEARDASDLATLLHDLDMQALKLFAAVSPIAASGGLPDALTKMVHAAADRHGIPIDVSSDAAGVRLDDFTAAQLYEIVREMVDGCLNDGKVEAINLEIGPNGEGERLSVRFVGAEGIRAIEDRALLQQLQYRATLIGVRLEASKSSGRDVVVQCTWPRSNTAVVHSG